jgi:membrane protein
MKAGPSRALVEANTAEADAANDIDRRGTGVRWRNLSMTSAASRAMPNVRYLDPRQYPRNGSGSEPTASRSERSLDESREGGRGRHAVAPWQIPWNGLLALFPAITALVSCYALLADASTVNQHLASLGSMLPGGAMDIVKEQVDRVLSKGDIKLGAAFAFSFLLALWSANGGMKAMIDALNVAYEESEERGFFKLNAVSLAFTMGGLVAVLVAIGAIVALPLVLSAIGLSAVTDAVIRYGRWPLLIAMTLLALAVLYRYAPSRRAPQWKWITPGSLFASVAWLAGSALLSFYLANYAHYDATYGSLGAAIGLMMWMWMSTIVILTGAELNAEVEHQTAEDTTEGGNKPLGDRGAEMADTLGAAKS